MQEYMVIYDWDQCTKQGIKRHRSNAANWENYGAIYLVNSMDALMDISNLHMLIKCCML